MLQALQQVLGHETDCAKARPKEQFPNVFSPIFSRRSGSFCKSPPSLQHPQCIVSSLSFVFTLFSHFFPPQVQGERISAREENRAIVSRIFFPLPSANRETCAICINYRLPIRDRYSAPPDPKRVPNTEVFTGYYSSQRPTSDSNRLTGPKKGNFLCCLTQDFSPSRRASAVKGLD